ncbi:hypothetical protein AHAS_Ahas11G0321300 [Arachis hypogaea]
MVGRKRNKISSLVDDNVNIITDPGLLESLATSFFLTLYYDSLLEVPFVINNSFPCLSDEDITHIGRIVTDLEIREATFPMGSFKAPRRDGLQAIFYQSQWDVIGADLCDLVKRLFYTPEEIGDIGRSQQWV